MHYEMWGTFIIGWEAFILGDGIFSPLQGLQGLQKVWAQHSGCRAYNGVQALNPRLSSFPLNPKALNCPNSPKRLCGLVGLGMEESGLRVEND